MSLVVMLAALSHEIIQIVLGKQWTDSAIIFKVFAFAAFIQPVVGTTGWVFISLGQTKRMMYWGLIGVPAIILSFVIGLPWGVLGVATSYTICFVVIIAVPSLLFAFRYSPVSLIGFFKTIWRPATISLIMYLALELTRRYLALYNPVRVAFYSCIMGVLVLVLCIIFWPRARNEALNTLRVVRMVTSQKETQ